MELKQQTGFYYTRIFMLALGLCLLASLFLIGPIASSVNAEDEFNLIEPDQLKRILGREDLRIIDARLTSHWEKSNWKIKGAERQNSKDFHLWADNYSKNEDIVIYCA